ERLPACRQRLAQGRRPVLRRLRHPARHRPADVPDQCRARAQAAPGRPFLGPVGRGPMSLLYLLAVVVSMLCMGLVDRRWRLFLFRRAVPALLVVAAGVGYFLLWDVVAIEQGMYVRGESPAMTGIEVAPELPLEELFFIVFLCYITMVFHGLFRRLLGTAAR